ncbi:A/G-specific adenine glycosylase [Faecalicatena contorta]|uniref:A/G-specific adenine glycosylase n=1 Tax=Faecalicatena contorta TaxID=39482 RepID=UPI001F40F467|nr:A/G-specific adenine glycosylase [Faecalicatena contorta]MCF2554030.1 DNA/RNA nuclease SfsA [Faecalicatena contorta]
MKYAGIKKATFLNRPNRFVARAVIDGKEETIHVKNTGRCAELLVPGTDIYIQESENPDRKTRWDLIAVRKGDRMINMDSQIPNRVVKEWLEEGNLIPGITKIRPEYTYGQSRIDLYVEAGERKILIEIKGVTLEEDGVVRFPDAPSERAVKHVHELSEAIKEGYEAYVFFVVQMKDVRYFTPNVRTHPEFAHALCEAAYAGVHVIARDCYVTEDSICVGDEVPVVLETPELYELVRPLVGWYRENKRELPWRNTKNPYHIWVSEIMLQQTRVEAVKPYYERFLKELPDVRSLAQAEEEKLLKLWEGLGYYNRVRNMQKAAQQIMTEYHGEFPNTYEEILSLKGIGNYTAGAISSFAYDLAYPAADGNVLRVVARITGDASDIMKQSTRKQMEDKLSKVIPSDASSDFNQGLIELGAVVCVPNGEPRCEQCPAASFCKARLEGRVEELPVRSKAKERKVQKKTVFVFRDSDRTAIVKRPDKGLLAGLYELPNVPGHLKRQEAEDYCKNIGLMPVRMKKLPAAKHIFSHVEWHMIGYEIWVDELEKTNKEEYLFIHPDEIMNVYPVPSAFDSYMEYI